MSSKSLTDDASQTASAQDRRVQGYGFSYRTLTFKTGCVSTDRNHKGLGLISTAAHDLTARTR